MHTEHVEHNKIPQQKVTNKDDKELKPCNCRVKSGCHLNGQCHQHNI